MEDKNLRSAKSPGLHFRQILHDREIEYPYSPRQCSVNIQDNLDLPSGLV